MRRRRGNDGAAPARAATPVNPPPDLPPSRWEERKAVPDALTLRLLPSGQVGRVGRKANRRRFSPPTFFSGEVGCPPLRKYGLPEHGRPSRQLGRNFSLWMRARGTPDAARRAAASSIIGGGPQR